MKGKEKPRVLIEEWLPAAAIGVECMRERSTGQNPPNARLHVWWARRPLCASRAAVLASLLPADFPHNVFERLLGFGIPGKELVRIRLMIDGIIPDTRIKKSFECDRAFKGIVYEDDQKKAFNEIHKIWGKNIVILDSMSGGGSIPLESVRIGFSTYANEYNPVACLILEATICYPFKFGIELSLKARKWGKIFRDRFVQRVGNFFPKTVSGGINRPDGYIFARAVPCPDTGFETPLVPDWHVMKPKTGTRIVAKPVVDKAKGTWRVQIREVGNYAGQLREAPAPTYSKGQGISLFTGRPITGDYIKAMAQQGRMKSVLYAMVLKTPQGLQFQPPEEADRAALREAEKELAHLRPAWEKENIIPTEKIPEGDKTKEALVRGMLKWADMFSPRQLLCMGVLVEELRRLRTEIIQSEGKDLGEAIVHMLSMVLDKFLNHNCSLTRWENTRAVIKSKMDRHDYSFKATFAEMAPCNAGVGLAWALDNVLDAYEDICKLPRHPNARPAEITMGSATRLPHIADKSITAVVVDPPYADNVQYSELADFFYVWLKRTQGHRRPEWFSTYLCEHDQEAVVNTSRHKNPGEKTQFARQRAHEFYQNLMLDVFRECRRVLRDDGVLTVMFTHKKQEAWEALFASLMKAGFMITATWPVKTESEHSIHIARKNSAESTVILVARKRDPEAGVGWFDNRMREEIRKAARRSAQRLKEEGLNAVDQLVGSFGPAMEVFSRYDEVRTDVGEPVGVARAIDEAADAVSRWRIEQLAARGLEGVEPEGQFYLLCWDVLGAAEFRFNEAKLLGHAVGMDVEQLVSVGLVSKVGEKIRILSARERRRERPLEPEEMEETLFGPIIKQKKQKKKDTLKVHPNDPRFRTALDGCQALALRYIEAGGGSGGVGSAKSLVRQQAWGRESPVARLMAALVQAAPEAFRFEKKGKKAAETPFPEFRAWHDMLSEVFGLPAPVWKEKEPPNQDLVEQVREMELENEEEEEESEEEET